MKKVLITVAAVLAVVAGLLFVQALRVQDKYGEWGLTASAPPLQVSTLGRDYRRGDLSPSDAAPPGLQANGETDDGATILVPTGMGDRVPVVIYVQDDDGDVWTYALVGGP